MYCTMNFSMYFHVLDNYKVSVCRNVSYVGAFWFVSGSYGYPSMQSLLGEYRVCGKSCNNIPNYCIIDHFLAKKLPVAGKSIRDKK